MPGPNLRLSGSIWSGILDSFLQLGTLALKRSTFEEDDSAKQDCESDASGDCGSVAGEVAHQQRSRSAERPNQIHGDHSATVAKTEIGQTVRGMVFAWRCKGQQAAASTRDADQRRIENRRSEDENRGEPRGEMIHLLQAQLEPERSHQESQKHGTAIAHKNLGGLEIPAEETCSGAEDCRGK